MTTRDQNIAEALRRVRAAADEDPARPPQGGQVAAGAPQSAPAGAPASATPAGPAAATNDQAAGRPETDHERQLEHDLEELAAKAEKADEYLALAQRTQADFENYRKRATREAAAAQERGIAKLAKELLPAVDNLDRALEAAAAREPGGRRTTGQRHRDARVGHQARPRRRDRRARPRGHRALLARGRAVRPAAPRGGRAACPSKAPSRGPSSRSTSADTGWARS